MLTFDEILELAKTRKPAIPFHVKAWGRDVFVRDPSSADADAWAYYAFRNKDREVPFAAKLAQIMLCDEEGNRVVPQTDDALEALADLPPAGLRELWDFCIPLVSNPSDGDVEAERKN